MAPYLFFIGVGTYATYRRRLEYPDGDSCLLELLVFPDVTEQQHAVVAMNAMHDNVMWVYTSCGPEAAEHVREREEIHALLLEREALKAKAGLLVVRVGVCPSVTAVVSLVPSCGRACVIDVEA
jgi:aminopeptidase N